jgi:hypothetical protein
VEVSRGVDDTVGETCKECVEMVLTTVVVERSWGGTTTTTVLEALMRDAGSTKVKIVVVEPALPLLYTVRVLDKVASMVIVMVVVGSARLVSDSVGSGSEMVVMTGSQRVVVIGPVSVVLGSCLGLIKVRRVVSPEIPMLEEADETAARALTTRHDFILKAVQVQQMHQSRLRREVEVLGDERAVLTRDGISSRKELKMLDDEASFNWNEEQ